jgi:hypothetical protein
VSEHPEKNHPVAGIVAAIVLSVILEILFAAMNPDSPAWRFLPFMLLWALISIYVFGIRKDSDDHAAHDAHAPAEH